MAARSMESTRALQENFETRFLETAANGQIDGDPNEINGFAHRIVSAETNGTFQIGHLVAMKLAFDKANVPAEGRVFIVDPVVEATINSIVSITNDLTEYARAILDAGMARGQRFVYNLFGWDILVSNRLPRGEFSDGTTTITDGVANIAMCISDDQTKPVMVAWRRQPRAEGGRNYDRARDEFVVRCRYGMGVQRTDTLGVIVTDATNYLPAA